jgi:hypothetical protein
MSCCKNSNESLGSKNDEKFGQLREYAVLKDGLELMKLDY